MLVVVQWMASFYPNTDLPNKFKDGTPDVMSRVHHTPYTVIIPIESEASHMTIFTNMQSCYPR
jgi:hypothetical protein